VRAGQSGFVSTLLVQAGGEIAKGDALIASDDPALQTELRRTEGKIAELKAEYDAEFVANRTKAEIVHDKMEGEQAKLALIRKRIYDLVARAGADCLFVAPEAADMPGHYYRKGEPLGYVIGKAPTRARVVVLQDAIGQLRLGVDRARLRLSEQIGAVFEGRVVREIPGGDENLPSPALAAQGGGEIATDPRETKTARALQRVFQLEVELSRADNRVDGFSQRVFVRFEHKGEPLGFQWYRNVRQFGVATVESGTPVDPSEPDDIGDLRAPSVCDMAAPY
jgi:putative peptide zinc metalloprotease protein